MNNRNNRATRAIVASGSLLAIILIGIPWVDDYLRLRREALEFEEMRALLVQNQSRDLQFTRIEEKLAKELNVLSAKSVDPARKSEIRETLVQIVRVSGGRLRRLEIPNAEKRIWAIEDDPRSNNTPTYGEESDLVLYTHTVELQADGSLETVRRIISEIGNQGWLLSTKSLTATPTGIRESPVMLELQLTLYGLGPNEDLEDELDEDFASWTKNRPGSVSVTDTQLANVTFPIR